MVSETSHSKKESIEELLLSFSNANTRKRRSFFETLEERIVEISDLGLKAFNCFDPNGYDWAAGWILQALYRKSQESLVDFQPFSEHGWFNAASEKGIDYEQFQKNLVAQKFEEADRFTSSILRQLAGSEAVERGYVYFSEVESMSKTDLMTLDRLWIAYSQGKFGFSVQGRILKSCGNRYDKLWPRIGWKKDGVWTRYPNSFDWSLNAPDGHMPLINQLRGVRLMDSLLNHQAIKSRI